MIKIENLSFSYEDKKVLENVNLDLNKGQVLCIIGPNGSGKTTLIDCILGINHYNKGSITYNNRDLNDFNYKDRAKLFSYVPQEKGNVFPYRVFEMVLMGRAPYQGVFSQPNRVDREVSYESLKKVGIEKFKDRLFTKLSGGEKQLVILARALAQESEIIVMDEPTSSLDYKNEFMFLDIIKELSIKNKKTIIMTTHFPNHGFFFENSGVDTVIATLSNKKINYYGRPKEVLTERNISEIYSIKSKVVNYDKNKKHIIPLGGINNEEE